MAKTLLRRSPLLVAALLGTSAILASSPSIAGEVREGLQFEVGVMGGAHIFATDSELGVADDPTLTSPGNAPLFGLRLGLIPHPMFGIEAEGVGIPTKDRQFDRSAFLAGFRGHLVYNIAPGQIAGGRLTPFVLAGAGVMTVASASGNSYYAIKPDTDFVFHGGLGLKFAFTDLVHARVDARALGVPNTTSKGFSPEYEFMAGIGFTFGGRVPPPPPPPAALIKDTDGDGIADDSDRCPTQAGSRENDGCPDKDTDGDGIVDRKDKCPDKAGPADREGCPVEDKDADGIPDDTDKCPEAAEDKDNFEDEDGCPDPDNDKDGVVDEKDKCPAEPESKNGYLDDDGCPDEVPAQIKKFTGVIKGINFRRNSADIKASSFPLLKQAVTVFKENPTLRVEISGHTSNEGRREFNMKLSRKRAEAVKLFLVSAGVDEGHVGTVGYGPDRPIESNDTKEGQEKNRRIEFRLLSTGEKVEQQTESEDIDPAPERKSKSKAKPEDKPKATKATKKAAPDEDPAPSKK